MMIAVVALLMALSWNAPAGPQTRARQATRATDRVTVYRVSTCGCCAKWVEHLKQAGFAVTVNVVDNVANVEGRTRVPAQLRTCHVAFVGPYTIEGHVPADVVKDLLKKRPTGVDGLAVPGMPAGSPGMESPYPQPYDVIAFDKKGATSVFARR